MDYTKETRKEALRTDWLSERREKGRYVHQRSTDRLDWESRTDGDSYSTYVFRDLKTMDLMKRAHEIATMYARTIVPDRDIRVTVGGNGSMTDGRTILVATQHFDRTDITPGEKVDIFVGLTVHECCHVLYTDFKNGAGMADDQVVRCMTNLLEDERIEELIGEEKPGLANFIWKAKRHYFDRLKKEMKASEDEGTPIARMLNLLIQIIRYPEDLDEKTLGERTEELEKIRNILSPYPETTKGCYEAALKIKDVIKKLIKEEMQRREQQEQQQNGDQSGQRQSGDGNRQDDGQEGSSAGGNNPEEGKDSQDGGKPQDGQHNANGSAGKDPTREEVQKEYERQSKLDGTKELLDTLAKMTENQKDKRGHDPETVSKEILRNRDAADIIEGKAELDAEGDCLTRPGQRDRRAYEESLNRVRKYIPAMTKALSYRTREAESRLHGTRSGRLDTNKLAEAIQGAQNVHTRETRTTSDRACVCVLVDESGSMRDKRMLSARDTAVLITEALGRVRNLEVFVYGFTSGNRDCELTIYKERKRAPNDSLGSTGAHSGTPTAEAVRGAADRIRRLSKSTCLMVVITDGMPDSSTKTAENIKAAEKDGFIVTGVGINSACGNMERLFGAGNFTTLTDMGTLANEIALTVRGRLLKAIKRRKTTF